jgi:peptide/nickel transport system permease protein
VITFVIRRIALSIPVLLVASVLVFFFVRATTDPLARVAQVNDPNAKTRLALQYGLQEEPCGPIVTTSPDGVRTEALTPGGQPILRCQKVSPVTQYVRYMGDLANRKLPPSQLTGRPVATELRDHLGPTVQLIFWGVLIAGLIAIACGVYSAVRQYSFLDYVFTGLTFVALAMPPFWFGLLAIQFGSIRSRDWFNLEDPLFYSIGIESTGPVDYARHLALPVATLCVQIIASWTRFQRSSMLDVMNADYIRTATAKGLARGKVVFKHGLRNGLIPLVTVMAIDIGSLFGGLIITEQIFSIPGMGGLFFDSLQNGDVNVLLPWLLLTATFVILFNLLADVLYGLLDPRIRVT